MPLGWVKLMCAFGDGIAQMQCLTHYIGRQFSRLYGIHCN